MPDRASCGRRGHPLALKTCFAFGGFESIYLSIYCFALPWFCCAFSGFEDAVSAPRLWTKWPSLGRPSRWGSAVLAPWPYVIAVMRAQTPWAGIVMGCCCFGTRPNIAVLHRLPLRPWTSFAIRLLVFASYSPRSLRRQDHCAVSTRSALREGPKH